MSKCVSGEAARKEAASHERASRPSSESPKTFKESMLLYKDGSRAPKDKRKALAHELCDRAIPMGGPLAATDPPDYVPSGDCTVDERGIHVDWFLYTFCYLPEVAFLDYGCPMWCVREHGIKEMLQRQGVSSGSLMDAVVSGKFYGFIRAAMWLISFLPFSSTGMPCISRNPTYTVMEIVWNMAM